MDRLAARIWRTTRRLDLMPPGTRVLAAVSGGADSVALAHLLRDLEPAAGFRLIGLAHLNHCLRGAAADEDERFCRDLAAGFDVPFECERIDVAALARSERLSIEAAGHTARYRFLEQAAIRLGADRVALGHTRDDQAETVLLRLLRGAGPRGLGGMYYRSGMFVRPMLDCNRTEIREFVANRCIPFREDASNADLSFTRNRIRHRLMPPLLEVERAAVGAISRAAEIARDDADLLDRWAADATRRFIVEAGDCVQLSVSLAEEAPAIARRVIALALARTVARNSTAGRVARPRAAGFRHIEAVRQLLRARPGSVLSLPGQLAERRDDWLVLRPGERRGSASGVGTNSFEFSLSIPGEVSSPSGWVLAAELGPVAQVGRPAATSPPDARLSAFLDAGQIAAPVTVRNWRPGDRFRPLGLAGTKKLQDFFVDRKVPRALRSAVPVVVHGDGRLIWVAGYEVSEDFRVTSATCDMVILKLEHWRNGT